LLGQRTEAGGGAGDFTVDEADAFPAGAEEPPEGGEKTGPESIVHSAMTAIQRKLMIHLGVASDATRQTLPCASDTQTADHPDGRRTNCYRLKGMRPLNREDAKRTLLTGLYTSGSRGKGMDAREAA
jgi:hypothetical protein